MVPLLQLMKTVKKMRRSKTQPISDVISQYIKEHNLGGKLSEADIINSWEKIVGKAIADKTKSITFKNGVMTVRLTSSVVRSELSMSKMLIIKRINEEAGNEVVKEIEFR